MAYKWSTVAANDIVKRTHLTELVDALTQKNAAVDKKASISAELNALASQSTLSAQLFDDIKSAATKIQNAAVCKLCSAENRHNNDYDY